MNKKERSGWGSKRRRNRRKLLTLIKDLRSMYYWRRTSPGQHMSVVESKGIFVKGKGIGEKCKREQEKSWRKKLQTMWKISIIGENITRPNYELDIGERISERTKELGEKKWWRCTQNRRRREAKNTNGLKIVYYRRNILEQSMKLMEGKNIREGERIKQEKKSGGIITENSKDEEKLQKTPKLCTIRGK